MDYTSFLLKHFKIIGLFWFFKLFVENEQSQVIVKKFYPDSITESNLRDLKNKYGNKKSLPKGFE